MDTGIARASFYAIGQLRHGWSTVSAGRLALGALAIVLVAAVVVGWRVRPVPMEDLVEPEAVTVELSQEEIVDSVPATILVDVGSPPVLPSAGGGGLVTAVPVSPGDTVDAGDVVVEVDRLALRALPTEAPLHRPIDRRSVGRDVEDLQAALAQLGLYDGPVDGRSGTATMDAVAAFLGVPPSSRLSLDPTQVLWLSESLPVFRVAVELGRPVPPVGEPLVIGPAPVLSAALTPDAGARFEGSWPARFESQDGALAASVTDDGSVAFEDVAAVVARLDQPPGRVELAGILRSAEAVLVTAAPTTAIVVGADGSACVWLAEPRSPVPVEPVGSSAIGATYLRPDPAIAGPVIVNPLEIGLSECSG